MKPIPILILTAFLLFFTTNAFVFAQNPPDSTASKGNISAESKQNTEGGLGVSFIHEDYAAAMSKAKADGKMVFLDAYTDRKSTRLNSSHPRLSRMPSSA